MKIVSGGQARVDRAPFGLYCGDCRRRWICRSGDHSIGGQAMPKDSQRWRFQLGFSRFLPSGICRNPKSLVWISNLFCCITYLLSIFRWKNNGKFHVLRIATLFVSLCLCARMNCTLCTSPGEKRGKNSGWTIHLKVFANIFLQKHQS